MASPVRFAGQSHPRVGHCAGRAGREFDTRRRCGASAELPCDHPGRDRGPWRTRRRRRPYEDVHRRPRRRRRVRRCPRRGLRGFPPASTMVVVSALLRPEWRIEIEAEALVGDDAAYFALASAGHAGARRVSAGRQMTATSRSTIISTPPKPPVPRSNSPPAKRDAFRRNRHERLRPAQRSRRRRIRGSRRRR